MMKHLLYALVLFSINVFAQQEATIKNGKKVILSDDGTWKYKDVTVKNTAQNNTIHDCNYYIDTRTDKVTGKSNTAAKTPIILSRDGGKTGFRMILMRPSSGEGLIMSTTAVGAGNCIDKDAKMNVLFRDGTRLELTNDGDFNCEGRYTLYFGGVFGKLFELETFKTQKIETLRIWTSNSFVEVDFTEQESQQITQIIGCLNE